MSLVCYQFFLLTVFLALEIYTVFFAVKAGSDRVRDTGVYALCRHSGMFWYIGLCFSMSFSLNLPLLTAGVYSLLNLIYIAIQDIVVFPRKIKGYVEYKKRIPFFPTYKSFVACLLYYLNKGNKNNAF